MAALISPKWMYLWILLGTGIAPWWSSKHFGIGRTIAVHMASYLFALILVGAINFGVARAVKWVRRRELEHVLTERAKRTDL